MKILLAIFTCHKYEYELCGMKDWFTRPVVDRVGALRDTWIKDVTVDYKFFYGHSLKRPKGDEIFLSVPDDYHHSYEKIRGIIQYALRHGYDYLLKVDDDVWVNWGKLDLSPTADYIGPSRGGRLTTYCAGFTYWLSRNSMKILSESPAGCWAEDVWVGEALLKKGIRCSFDERYYCVNPTQTNQYISDEELAQPNDYLSIHSLTPSQMRRYYAERHTDLHQQPR